MRVGLTSEPQLEVASSQHEDSKGPYLITSPYNEPEHQLDLGTLDNEGALLAESLVHLSCIRDDYATSPYPETFNWGQVMAVLRTLAKTRGFRETSFYIVAFRSQIPPSTVYEKLGALDKAAHAEANAGGGFLKYWFGKPDEEGRNLATCVWRSRKDAVKANQGEAHRAATRATASMYTAWKIDRHRLLVREGAEDWEMTDWTE